MNALHAFLGVLAVVALFASYQAVRFFWFDNFLAARRDRANARRNGGIIVNDFRI